MNIKYCEENVCDEGCLCYNNSGYNCGCKNLKSRTVYKNIRTKIFKSKSNGDII